MSQKAASWELRWKDVIDKAGERRKLQALLRKPGPGGCNWVASCDSFFFKCKNVFFGYQEKLFRTFNQMAVSSQIKILNHKILGSYKAGGLQIWCLLMSTALWGSRSSRGLPHIKGLVLFCNEETKNASPRTPYYGRII